MKAKELKFGDWVYAKNPITCEDMPCKVEKFNDDKVLAGLIWCHFDELSPILLTEEILEKNRWRKDIHHTDKPCYTNGWLCLQKTKGHWHFWHGDRYLITIYYVHELQHILWALGIDDNLKI